MKTHDLVSLSSLDNISDALKEMKPKEREKHARKISNSLGLTYGKAILRASKVVLDANPDDDFLEKIYNDALEKVNFNFSSADEALLSEISYLTSINEKQEKIDLLSKEYLNVRSNRAKMISILCLLLFVILATRTNLFHEREALKAEINLLRIFQFST